MTRRVAGSFALLLALLSLGLAPAGASASDIEAMAARDGGAVLDLTPVARVAQAGRRQPRVAAGELPRLRRRAAPHNEPGGPVPPRRRGVGGLGLPGRRPLRDPRERGARRLNQPGGGVLRGRRLEQDLHRERGRGAPHPGRRRGRRERG